MAVNAIVKEGKIMETASQSSVSGAASSVSPTNGYDKDAFLQLLVAQMKYQDPLEPTENTEYISQYATFSQVEQLQNMAGSMDLYRASGMVGQTVQITTTGADGESKFIEGVVDYVKYESGKAYVAVNGELYASGDVTAILDNEYNTAYELAQSFAKAVEELPNLGNITLADKDTIYSLAEGYNSLSDYQKSMIDETYYNKLGEYVERMNQMVKDSEASMKAQEEAAKENTEEDTEAEESSEGEGAAGEA